MSVNVNDLDKETRKKLGLKLTRQQSFSKEAVRSHAIRVLAEIADLTQDQRRRVLEHAIKVNKA